MTFLGEQNLSPQSTHLEKTTSLEEALLRDIEQFQSQLSRVLEGQIEQIETARLKGEYKGQFEKLSEIRGNKYQWASLDKRTQSKVLCIYACLELDINNNKIEAMKLLEEAEEIQKTDRTDRLRAYLQFISGNNPEVAIELLQNKKDIDSRNLLASIYLETSRLNEAKGIINFDEDTDANFETYRLYALIHLAERNLSHANTFIEKALEFSKRTNVRFLQGRIYYLSTLSEAAEKKYFSEMVPVPTSWIYIKNDQTSLENLRKAEDIYRNLIIESKETSGDVTLPELGLLACLANDPSRYKAAIRYCTSLLQRNPNHLTVIVWAISRFHGIDFEQSITRLSNLIDNGDATIRDIMALADIYFATEMLEQLESLLKKTQLVFEKEQHIDEWAYLHIRRLLLLDQVEDVEPLLNSLSLSEEAKFDLKSMYLKYKARVYDNWHDLIGHLQQHFNATKDIEVLYDLCYGLSQAKKWNELLEYLDVLTYNIDTKLVHVFAIESLYNAGKYERCLNAIIRFSERFNVEDQDGKIAHIESRCLEFTSRHLDAIQKLQELVAKNPIELIYKFDLIRLYHTVGNHTSIEIMARQFLNDKLINSEILIEIMDLIRNPSLRRDLWQAALMRGISDDYVSKAYIRGMMSLGLHDDPNMRVLEERIAQLGRESKGGIQLFHVSELRDHLKTDDEPRFDYIQEYISATVPIHLVADHLNLPLVQLYRYILQNNEENPDPLHQSTIFARHGSRPLAKLSNDEINSIRMHLDITSIMLADHLEILPKIEQVFNKIYISEMLLPSISYMESQISQGQPDILEAQKEISHLIDRDSIHVLDFNEPNIIHNSYLKNEIRLEQITLLEYVRNNDGYMLTYLPLMKPDLSGDTAKLDSSITNYLVDISAIVTELYKRGKLSNLLYNKALKFVKNTYACDTSRLKENTIIVCDGYIAQTLAKTGILNIACSFFRIYITKEQLHHIRTSITFHDNAQQMVDWIRNLSDYISQGITKNRYLVTPAIQNRTSNQSRYLDCLTTLLAAPKETNDVICVDDRYVNRIPFGEVKFIGISEILHILYTENKISEGDYYDYITRLRAANLRYIPLDSEEILYYLKEARIADNKLLETYALKVLRKYVASCMYQIDFLQISPEPEHFMDQNGELAFVASLKMAVFSVIRQIWQLVDDNSHRKILGDWVYTHLFLDYLAYSEYQLQEIENYNYIDRRLVPNLLGLAFYPIWNLQENEQELSDDRRRADYLDWLWSTVLHPLIDKNPEILVKLSEQIKSSIQDVLRNLPRTEISRQAGNLFVYNIFQDLPFELQNQIAQDTNFMNQYGLKFVRTMQFADLTFLVEEFWQAVKDTLNGVESRLTSLESETELVFKVKQFTETRIVTLNDEKNDVTIDVLDAPLVSPLPEEVDYYLSQIYNFLDLNKDEFQEYRNKTLAETIAWKRFDLREYHYRQSATIYFDRLRRKLNFSKPSTLFNLMEFIPLSINSLLKHLRVPLEYDDLQKQLAASAVSLSRESLIAAIFRYSTLPCPLPIELLNALENLSIVERKSVIHQLIRSDGSPISLFHLLKILNYFSREDPSYRRLSLSITRRLTTRAFAEDFETFRTISLWVTQMFGLVSDIRDHKSPSILLSIWVQSHYLYTILVGYGMSLSDIAEFLLVKTSTLSWETFEKLEDCRYDIAFPTHLSFEFFTTFSLAYSFESMSLDQDNIYEIIRIVILLMYNIRDEDNMEPVYSRYKPLSQASNSLGSYFGNDLILTLDSLPHEITSPFSLETIQEYVDSLVTQLENDDKQAWHDIVNMFGRWPIYDFLQDRVLSLIVLTDFISILQDDWNAGTSAIKFVFTQIGNFYSEELKNKAKLLLFELSDFFGEDLSIIPDNLNRNKATIAEEMILFGVLNLFIIDSKSSTQRVSELSETIEHILANWKHKTEFSRNLLENIVRMLPENEAIQLWPQLLKLRAQS